VHAWLREKRIRAVATTLRHRALYRRRSARSARGRHGQRAVRLERLLAEACDLAVRIRWPARRLAQRRHGHDRHALRGRAATQRQAIGVRLSASGSRPTLPCPAPCSRAAHSRGHAARRRGRTSDLWRVRRRRSASSAARPPTQRAPQPSHSAPTTCAAPSEIRFVTGGSPSAISRPLIQDQSTTGSPLVMKYALPAAADPAPAPVKWSSIR